MNPTKFLQPSFLLSAAFFVSILPIVVHCQQATITLSKDLNSVTSDSLSQSDQQSLLKWTSTAFKFFDFHRCTSSNIGSEDECFQLSQIRRTQVAVFAGRANPYTNLPKDFLHPGKFSSGRKSPKVHAVLPDSASVKASGAHDVILALDPYPQANFGHLVALFYVDFEVDARFCSEEHQIFGADNTCVTVARKPRCPNLLERHIGGLQPRRCHVDFIPVVHVASNLPDFLEDTSSGHAQDLMECVSLPGFAHCPKYRPVEETDKVLCDAAQSNAKRCDTSYSGVGTRCKLFQTCDRAVLVGGGWNRLHSGLQSIQNVLKMEDSLKKVGFLTENIKIFYANGKPGAGDSRRNAAGSILSSAMKTGLRGHLRTICETRHCADSLFIYLNNPTTIEGDMLLWDVDYNGMADDLETYSAKEFLTDISRCEAKRVVILADQSNSDILMTLLKQSKEHPNVMLFTAGLPNQITINGELTNTWMENIHPISCLKQIQQTMGIQMKSSNPSTFDGSFGSTSSVSVIGAPCDLNPPLSSRELRSLYQGCQNVPTSVWFSFNFDGISDTDDDDDADSGDENSPSSRRGQ